MATFTQRVEYTITAQDIIDGYATVPVVWENPFPSMNFTTTIGIIKKTQSNFVYGVGNIQNADENGFDAIIIITTGGVGAEGDVVEINAVGIED